jgi:hypothetical protein
MGPGTAAGWVSEPETRPQKAVSGIASRLANNAVNTAPPAYPVRPPNPMFNPRKSFAALPPSSAAGGHGSCAAAPNPLVEMKLRRGRPPLRWQLVRQLRPLLLDHLAEIVRDVRDSVRLKQKLMQPHEIVLHHDAVRDNSGYIDAHTRLPALATGASRSASCVSDNAKRNPSHSARNAAVSGLLAGAEGRINRKMVDFATPTSRVALPKVSAILVAPAGWKRRRDKPYRDWLTNPLLRAALRCLAADVSKVTPASAMATGGSRTSMWSLVSRVCLAHPQEFGEGKAGGE